MCLYPKLIKNKKYIKNKKNGGIIPPISDERVLYVAVGCGDCMECSKQKARNWQLRLIEEVKHNKNGKFITLTFSTESFKKLAKEFPDTTGYALDNSITKLAVRRFLERWRKHHKVSVRHWLITELGHGKTEHVHLHGIIWTNDIHEIEKQWQYGYVWKGYYQYGRYTNYVSERTATYITKYITKKDIKHKTYRPIILSSNKPGIGNNYIKSNKAQTNKFNNEKTKEYYTTDSGHRIAMPKYWRNAIYSEEEREKLWLQMLDKEIRYVNGEKVDISKGEEQYYKLLEYHRKKNKKLGYGDGEKDWDRIQYEENRRNMIHKKRIE